MRVSVNGKSRTPKHRQIAEQIHTQIVEGKLLPGYQLPPIRALAARVGVSPLTVFHAYESLKSSGLTESIVGSGTRVSDRLSPKTATGVLQQSIRSSPMNLFEPMSVQAGIRSLASAIPDPTLFHLDEFLLEIQDMKHASPWRLYYTPNEGDPILLREVARHLEGHGLDASQESLLVTEGSTQALYLAISALTSLGDSMLIQEPSRLMLTALVQSLGRKVVGWRHDSAQIDVESLKKSIQKYRPRMAIIAPTFGASTGLVWSASLRKEFGAIAKHFKVILVEDGSYADLRYDREDLPAPLTALGGADSVYVGSFAYSLSSSVNIGFVHATGVTKDRLSSHLQRMRQSGSPILQAALASFLARNGLVRHLRSVLPKYRARRDTLLHALEMHAPRGMTWTKPLGGLSTWLTVPRLSSEFGHSALKQGVAVTLGASLAANADTNLRLSFGVQSPEAIREAIRSIAPLLA